VVSHMANHNQMGTSINLARRVPFLFYISIFVDLLCVAMMVPLMPAHAERVGISKKMLGAVQAVYGFMQVISTPALGLLSDRVGPRAILMVSLGGTSLAYLLLCVAVANHSMWLFLVSRVVVGGLRQTMTVGSAFVVKRAGGKSEGLAAQAMSRFQAAASLGFVVGPALGGIAADAGFVVELCAVSAALDAGNCILMWFVTRPLPSDCSPAAVGDTPANPKRTNVLRLLPEMLGRPLQGPLLAVMYASSLSYITIQSTLPTIAKETFGVSFTTVGTVISSASALNVLVQGAAVPELVKRIAPRRIVQVAVCITAVGYVCESLATTMNVFLVGLLVCSVFSGPVDTLNRARLTSLYPTSRSGEILSVVFSIDGFNRVVAPLISGFGMDYTGGTVFPRAMATVLSVIMALVYLLKL
jgi:MFS family permease